MNIYAEYISSPFHSEQTRTVNNVVTAAIRLQLVYQKL